jgi:haloacetate dehalogenase
MHDPTPALRRIGNSMSALPTALFGGFSRLDCTTPRVRFAGVTGGEGPPVLLLHGYPQTHAT